MIKILIYHSDSSVLKFISNAVIHYFESVNYPCNIFQSQEIDKVAAFLKKNCSWIDIAFFDYNDFENSLRLGAFLRKSNEKSSIVHIGNTDTLIKSLIQRPSAFISDPMDNSQVTRIIACLDTFHRKASAEYGLTFRFQGEPLYIAYKNIEYFESNAKKVIIHTIQGSSDYYFTSKLDDLEKRLPSFFLRCHQSYLVNMNRILRIDVINKTFVTHSNDTVLISRRMMSVARQKYEDFLKK